MKTRNGCEVRILSVSDDNVPFPLVGHYFYEGEWRPCLWTKDGRYYADNLDCMFDILDYGIIRKEPFKNVQEALEKYCKEFSITGDSPALCVISDARSLRKQLQEANAKNAALELGISYVTDANNNQMKQLNDSATELYNMRDVNKNLDHELQRYRSMLADAVSKHDGSPLRSINREVVKLIIRAALEMP